MSRIELSDSTVDAIIKMSDGNPGAVMALMEISEKAGSIDPQSALGGIGPILSLDTWEIYGSSIYVLFNDKAGRDVRKLLVLLRATQLGLFSVAKLQQMAADQAREINLSDEEWTELDEKVCAQLAEFQRPQTALMISETG